MKLKKYILKKLSIIGILLLCPSFVSIVVAQQSNKKWHIVKLNKYPEIAHGLLTCSFMDNDGDKSTIESVNLINSSAEQKMNYAVDCGVEITEDIFGPADIRSAVENLTDYTFNIIGDDGNSFGKLEYSQINLKNLKSVSRADLVEDLRLFAPNDSNHAFSIKQVYVDLIPNNINHGLQTRIEGVTKFDASLIKKNDMKSYYHGNQIFLGSLETKRGKYTFSFLSNDGNNDNYEVIQMQRNDSLNYIIQSLIQLDLMFLSNENMASKSNKEEMVSLNMINIGWPEVGSFYIFDNELYNALYALSEDEKFNKAFPLMVVDQRVNVISKGILTMGKEIDVKIIK